MMITDRLNELIDGVGMNEDEDDDDDDAHRVCSDDGDD